MDFAKAVINIVKRDGNHKEIMGVWEPPLNNFFFLGIWKRVFLFL